MPKSCTIKNKGLINVYRIVNDCRAWYITRRGLSNHISIMNARLKR